MEWNFKVYEEPGILFADRTVEQDEAPFELIDELIKPGVEQGRKVLAVITPGDGGDPILAPQAEHEDKTFDDLAQEIPPMLGEGEAFAAASLCDAAMRGAHGHDPELQLLAASVFEHIGFWELAAPILGKVAKSFDGVREAAVTIRYARALKRSGAQDDVSEMVEAPLAMEELPPILRVEGMLLQAMCKEREEGLEILDELLDYAEEHLGEHRLVADALELHADFLSDSEPEKAGKFYHAAGKMLVELKDPYFFSLNERFVVHFLKHKAYKEAVDLSHEMYELLQQVNGPPVAAVPYFVFAGWAHKALGNKDRSEQATKTAHGIDKVEAKRLEQMLETILN